MSETTGYCTCTHTTEIHPVAECDEQAVAMFARLDAADREALTDVILDVSQRWDEPLDEVHDVPQIVDAVLARFRLVSR